ncbi:MAG: serine protease [Firmicutes bacterium]|nr:serine protease [Bacillota bacterium]
MRRLIRWGGIAVLSVFATACGSAAPPTASPSKTVTVTVSVSSSTSTPRQPVTTAPSSAASPSSTQTVPPSPSFSSPPSISASTTMGAAAWSSLLSGDAPSVVRITTYANDFGTAIVSGSGFWTDGYIVTCYHVIENAHLFIDVWPANSATDEHAYVVATDPAQDLALLALDNGSHASGLPLATAPQTVGEPVAIMGFPGGGQELYITPGTLTSTDATINVQGYGTLSPMLGLNAASIGGDSGGPVFNAQGQVIGVLEDGDAGVAANGGAVPVSSLSAFLANQPSPSAPS